MEHPKSKSTKPGSKICLPKNNLVLGEILLQTPAEELSFRGESDPQRLRRRPGRRVLRHPLGEPAVEMRGPEPAQRWRSHDTDS